MVEYAERWGLDLSRLRHCLLTHAHHDHTRAAAEWQERFGVEVWASPPVADALRDVDVRTLAYSCPEGTFPPCAVDRIVEDGTTIAVGDLEVAAVAAPGHSDGDTAYLLDVEGLRVAFVGDLFTYDGVETVGFAYPFDPRRDPLRQVESMLRLYELRPDLILPGHGMIALRRGWRWLGTALHSVEKTGVSLSLASGEPDAVA